MKLIGCALALSSSLLTTVLAHEGTCGFECTADTDCVGCGVSGTGRCSCPDEGGKYPAISCSCVSQPKDNVPPGTSNSSDASWPGQWTANVEAYSYPDFGHKTATAKGKFFYDGVGDHSRAEWSPYTSGKDAVQVWIAGTGTDASNYYVKSGGVCIYFPITDPGTPGKSNIGIERPDWVQTCDKAGFAKFVAREQVMVDGTPTWADHWTCHIEYVAVNQSITFQNWHSIEGLNKGLPLRVTGGNSAPNPQKGSPRMNTVWYTNFTVGSDAVKPTDFVKPGFICIPVGEEEAEKFFGHKLSNSHAFQPSFHHRAHFLPHALKPTASDMGRAEQPKPSEPFKGRNFEDAMYKLNDILLSSDGLMTSACSEFSLSELFDTMTTLFNARSPSLQNVYSGARDTRNMAHMDLAELQKEQTVFEELVKRRPEVFEIVRDGLCHEAVMWFVHHLSEAAKKEVKKIVNMPLLPSTLHTAPKDEQYLAQRYQDQVSCAVCHVA